MPKRKKKISLTDIAKERLALRKIKKQEYRKERKCASPYCDKMFTWKDKKIGQKYCSTLCVLNDPERLVGRKSVVDDDTLAKLRYAFMIGCTDGEACDYAGISVDAMNNYQNKFPEFKGEKEGLKNARVLKSRIKVYESIDENTELAKWNLEKLRKKEYGNKGSFDVVFNGEIDEKHKEIARGLLNRMVPKEVEEDFEEE